MKIALQGGNEVTIRVHQRPEDGETLSIVAVGDHEYTGKARVHKGDIFSRHRGLQLSMARALAKARLGKDNRKVIWDKLFNYKYT